MKLKVSKEFLRKVLNSKLNGGNLVQGVSAWAVSFHGSEERLIQATRGDKLDGLEATSVLKRAKKKKRLQDWEEIALHGQYLKLTKGQSCVWLQSGDLKRDTASLIVVAQNTCIRANLVKAQINKRQKDTLCRLCKKADESMDHVVSGCNELALKEYERKA